TRRRSRIPSMRRATSPSDRRGGGVACGAPVRARSSGASLAARSAGRAEWVPGGDASAPGIGTRRGSDLADDDEARVDGRSRVRQEIGREDVTAKQVCGLPCLVELVVDVRAFRQQEETADPEERQA